MIVGMDTNSYGYHYVTDRTGQYGHYQAPKDLSAQERRAAIYSYARAFCAGLMPGSHVFIEEPLVLRTNTETTRKLVMVGGIIEAAFWEVKPNATLYWVDVMVWRKAVLGKASGRKEQLKELALGWAATYRPDLGDLEEDDTADAACICEYGRLVTADDVAVRMADRPEDTASSVWGDRCGAPQNPSPLVTTSFCMKKAGHDGPHSWSNVAADSPASVPGQWDFCSCDRTYHDECPDHGIYGAGLGPSGKAVKPPASVPTGDSASGSAPPAIRKDAGHPGQRITEALASDGGAARDPEGTP